MTMQRDELLVRVRDMSVGNFGLIWNGLFPETNAMVIWSILVDAYSKPEGREYHNVGHVSDLLKLLHSYDAELNFTESTLREMAIAIYFHDAIYTPGSDVNELRSAQLFHMASGHDKLSGAAERIYDMIMATTHKQHNPDFSIPAQFVCDLDLFGLGCSWGVYADNYVRIRKEFAHVDAENWLAGRKKFLESMLNRKKIYYNPFSLESFKNLEANARQNLNKELFFISSWKLPE